MTDKIQEMYIGEFGFDDKYFRIIFPHNDIPAIHENHPSIESVVDSITSHYKIWRFEELKIYGLRNVSSTPVIKPISTNQYADIKLQLETSKRIKDYNFKTDINDLVRSEQELAYSLADVVNN